MLLVIHISTLFEKLPNNSPHFRYALFLHSNTATFVDFQSRVYVFAVMNEIVAREVTIYTNGEQCSGRRGAFLNN